MSVEDDLRRELQQEREKNTRIGALIKREADLHNERQIRLEKAEAELADIKAGKGWYEISPGGQKKHCWTSDEEELKSARAELAEARKELEVWRELWEAFREALNEDGPRPYRGWFRLRKFLESGGQYIDSLGDDALLIEAIDAATQSNSTEEGKEK